MASSIKPIKVYGQGGPNPPKVAIILKELGLPYEVEPIQISDVKQPHYVAINPNGRLPSIADPNTNITLWESGAIVEYLIERYDKDRRLSFAPGSPESYHTKQWLFFQATGQGPYYGQAAWFKRYHPEKVPSALDRYIKEMNRVSGVLDGYLGQQKEKYGSGTGSGDGPWLVGNKLSYADLAFVPYQTIMPFLFDKCDYDVDNFPNVKAWLGNMTARETVKAALGEGGVLK